MRQTATRAFISGCLLLLCGCNAGHEEHHDARKAGQAPQRIVCGTPAITEIVFALGCGDRVVGVSQHTVYPPEATQREVIGGWFNPNRERLLVLEPDIIITQGEHKKLAAFTQQYDMHFLAVKLDTLQDFYEAVQRIADTLHVQEAGIALTQRIRSTIASMVLSDRDPVPVLVLIGRTPGTLTGLTAVGPGTFLDDIVRVVGGSNIFHDAKGIYPQASKESILVRKPEVILEVLPGDQSEQTQKQLRADWQHLKELPAVKHDRIYYLTNDFLLIPGSRIGNTAKTLADAIHGKQ